MKNFNRLLLTFLSMATVHAAEKQPFTNIGQDTLNKIMIEQRNRASFISQLSIKELVKLSKVSKPTNTICKAIFKKVEAALGELKNLNKFAPKMITTQLGKPLATILLQNKALTFYDIEQLATNSFYNEYFEPILKQLDLCNKYHNQTQKLLDLSYCGARYIYPLVLHKFRDLKFFNGAGNQLTTLPKNIEILKRIEVIDLWYNHLENLTETIGSLTNLKVSIFTITN